MKLPKTINLLDGEYTIKLVNHEKLIYKDGYDSFHNGYCLGRIYHIDKVILINKEESYEQQVITLWHEILHHCFNFLQMRNDEGSVITISKLITRIQKEIK